MPPYIEFRNGGIPNYVIQKEMNKVKISKLSSTSTTKWDNTN